MKKVLMKVFCLWLATSIVFNISMVPAFASDSLSISLQPENQEVTAGSAAVFTVEATGGTEPYTYMWEVNTVSDWMPATSANGYEYRCNITDSSPETATTSEATVTVSQTNNTSSTIVTTAPLIPPNIITINDPFVYENTTTLASNTNTDETSKIIKDAVIYAKNISLNIGDEFQLMDGVTARDDGGNGEDLTDKVTMSGKINTNVEGKFKITYKVTGENGKTVTKKIVVTVKPCE